MPVPVPVPLSLLVLVLVFVLVLVVVLLVLLLVVVLLLEELPICSPLSMRSSERRHTSPCASWGITWVRMRVCMSGFQFTAKSTHRWE